MAHPRNIIPGLNDNEGGRPSPLTRPYDTREDGTPRTVGEAIIDTVRRGEWMDTASALVGIATETARSWLRTAARADLRTQTDPAYIPTQHEASCRIFSAGYRQACAEWTNEFLAQHDRDAAGGRRLTTTRVKRSAPTANHPAGEIIESITETREVPPDLRAQEWRLAIRDRDRFAAKVQISRAPLDGDLSEEDMAAELVATVEGYIAGRAEAEAEQSAP